MTDAMRGRYVLFTKYILFSSTSGLERYWWAFCVKSPSWNASSLICCCFFCRHTWWLAPSNLPALLFSFCIFTLIYPVYDISYSQFFCGVFIIYIFLLVSVGQRVVLNSITWFFCWKSTGSVFTAYTHAPWVMKNMSYSGNTHAHFAQAHICICRKKI